MLILGQRLEEEIDLPMRRARLRPRPQSQDAFGDAQVGVGRNHVDVIRLDAQIVRDLVHRERRRASEELRECTLMFRIEMLHEHEAHAGIYRQMLQYLRECVQSAC